jgi:hypothetical protein
MVIRVIRNRQVIRVNKFFRVTSRVIRISKIIGIRMIV